MICQLRKYSTFKPCARLLWWHFNGITITWSPIITCCGCSQTFCGIQSSETFTQHSFVCVEVLWPTKPIGVMSVYLPPLFSWACFILQAVNQYLGTFFCQKLTTALLISAEGMEWPQKIFHDQSRKKNVAGLGRDQTSALLSPVGHAFDWATEACPLNMIQKVYHNTVVRIHLCSLTWAFSTDTFYNIHWFLNWAIDALISLHNCAGWSEHFDWLCWCLTTCHPCGSFCVISQRKGENR